MAIGNPESSLQEASRVQLHGDQGSVSPTPHPTGWCVAPKEGLHPGPALRRGQKG